MGQQYILLKKTNILPRIKIGSEPSNENELEFRYLKSTKHKNTKAQHIQLTITKSIIDYILPKQKNNIQFHDVRVYRGARYGSDYYCIRSKVFFLSLRPD